MTISWKDKLAAGRAVLENKVKEVRTDVDKSITAQTLIGAADGAFGALKRKVADYSGKANDYLEKRAAGGSDLAQVVLAGSRRVKDFHADIKERYQILLNETSPLRILVPGYDDIASLIDQELKIDSEQKYSRSKDGYSIDVDKSTKKTLLTKGSKKLLIATSKDMDDMLTGCTLEINYLPQQDQEYVALFHALAKNALEIAKDELGMDVQRKTAETATYAGKRSSFIGVGQVQYAYDIEAKFENNAFCIAYTPKDRGMKFEIKGVMKDTDAPING